MKITANRSVAIVLQAATSTKLALKTLFPLIGAGSANAASVRWGNRSPPMPRRSASLVLRASIACESQKPRQGLTFAAVARLVNTLSTTRSAWSVNSAGMRLPRSFRSALNARVATTQALQ